MTNFELAKKNYDRGLWTGDMLQKLVSKGKLTQEECRTITEGDNG